MNKSQPLQISQKNKRFFSKRRLILSLGCFGFFAVWVYFLNPVWLDLPNNFSYTAQVVSYDNFFNQSTQSYAGEQQSATRFSYSTEKNQGKNLLIKNIFEVKSLNGDKIFSVTRNYGIDSNTGRHVKGLGDHDREGFLFAPRMKGLTAQVPDKSSFNYWHVNYDVPARMDFRAEENLYGLKVYRYESNFIADQTQELSNLPEVGKTLGITLNVHLIIWIEPYTGQMTQYRDDTEAFYYDLKTGQTLYPWNKFYNYFAPSSAAEHASTISIQKQKTLILGTIVPLGLLCLGVLAVCLLIFSVTVFKRRTNYGHQSIVWLFPLTTFLVSIGSSVLIYLFLNASLKQQREAEFHSAAQEINQSVLNRFEIYSNMLRGGRGLFDASESVERDEWKAYVGSLDIQKNYPGIQGLGFAKVFLPEEKQAVVDVVRADGYPDFDVKPPGDRPFYSSIIYLEPLDARNLRAFGFDMLTENTRKTAMDFARDSGLVTVSGKVTLLQENTSDVQAGFLMYEPVYKKNLPVGTPEERRLALDGFVYSPFRMNDFMTGALLNVNKKISIEIYDTADPESLVPEKIMYQNAKFDAKALSDVRTVMVGGRSFTLRFSAPADYGQDFVRSILPLGFLILAIIFSLLLFAGSYYLLTGRRRAEKYALAMNVEVLKNQDELRKAKSLLETELSEAERLNKIMVDRELKMIELKQEITSLKKNNGKSV